MRRRVVITGIGVVSPLGSDRETTWRRARAGALAVRRLCFDLPTGRFLALGAPAAIVQSQQTELAGESRPRDEKNVGRLSQTSLRPTGELKGPSTLVAAANPSPVNLQTRSPIGLHRDTETVGDQLALAAPIGWAGEAGERPDRLLELARRAAGEAMRDAGLRWTQVPDENRHRYGCCVGNSKGNLESGLAALDQLETTGVVDPRLWLGLCPSTLSSQLAAQFGLQGPVHCPVAACATGLLSVIQAAHWIAEGRCDVALAGSADAALTPMVLGSYQRMGVLAPSDVDDPSRAVRPFAANRQGFAVGEGAGMFIVEDATSAAERGATVYAEIVGSAQTSDAKTLTTLSDDPEALAYCIRAAIAKAGLAPEDIGHVNCHGTATQTNDPWETLGIKRAFGEHASRLRLTANKSMIGHLLGAAGSVELALTALALRDQFIPPTMNLERPDPACDLNYCAQVGRPHGFRSAMKVSFGFGGHIAAVVLRRVEGLASLQRRGVKNL